MKSYWVDFGCWKITGKDDEEAYNKAVKYVEQGFVPKIAGTDECDESDYVDKDELYDYIQLEIKNEGGEQNE